MSGFLLIPSCHLPKSRGELNPRKSEPIRSQRLEWSLFYMHECPLVLPQGFNVNSFVTTDGLQMGRWTRPKSHKNSAKWDKYVARTSPRCCAESKAGLFYSLDLSDSLLCLSWGVQLSFRKYKVSILKPCICCAYLSLASQNCYFWCSNGIEKQTFSF